MKKASLYKTGIALCIVGGFLWVGSSLLPELTAQVWQRQLSQTTGSEDIHVRIQANPSLKLLGGHIDYLHIYGQDMRLGKLLVSGASLEMDDLSVKIWDSLWNERITISDIRQGNAVLSLNDRDLQDYLEKEVPEIKEPSVHIDEDGVTIEGKVKIFGSLQKGVLKTAVEIGQDGLVLIPKQVKIGPLQLSGVQSVYTKQIHLFKTKDFPVQIVPQKLLLKKGELIFYAEVTA